MALLPRSGFLVSSIEMIQYWGTALTLVLSEWNARVFTDDGHARARRRAASFSEQDTCRAGRVASPIVSEAEEDVGATHRGSLTLDQQ